MEVETIRTLGARTQMGINTFLFPSAEFAVWVAEFYDPLTGRRTGAISTAVSTPDRIGYTYPEFLGMVGAAVGMSGNCYRIYSRNVDLGLWRNINS